MPTYILFSFSAACFFALQYIFEKITAKHAIKSRSGLLFYLYVSFLPFALLLPLFIKLTWPQDAWAPIWLHSLSFFIGNFIFFTAIFKVDASVFAPLFQVQTAFLALLAFLFLREQFPLESYLWVSVMILGAMLVAGLLGAAGYTLLLRAYQENLTLSNTFALLASPIVLLITVFASRLRPKLLEHHPGKVYLIRAVGVLLILFGALRISLGG